MDTMNADRLVDELSRFADPGSDGVRFEKLASSARVSLVRNGAAVMLESMDFYNARITATVEGVSRSFDTYRSLLASDLFGDLSVWAARQRDVLRVKFPSDDLQIQPEGLLQPGGGRVASFSDVQDAVVSVQNSSESVGVFLIDGPAGVGKTNLIERLAFHAAENFGRTKTRLVLHVLSRGKVLSNIEDLMAYSLQTLRLQVAFDQVPVLVRHGLITLAIDGFDELGDPEGFNHAWGQLNDLIDFVRGEGCLILAGRETFIGRYRLLKYVKGLNVDANVRELALDETPPHLAEEWLLRKGCDNGAVQVLKEAGLLERGSFALRPFFLSFLQKELLTESIEAIEDYSRLGDVLPLVVNGMIDREVRRYRGDVASELGEDGVREYIVKLYSEIAREMAGDQSESISESMLGWIVDLSLREGVDPAIAATLRARAVSGAFLSPDDRPSFRRFGHSQFFNFFLSQSTLDSVAVGDVPKWLRRGVVGPDFLVAFVPFLRVRAARDNNTVQKFRDELEKLAVVSIDPRDGSQLAKNLVALSFATLSLSSASSPVQTVGGEVHYAFAGSGTFYGRVAIGFAHVLDLRSCDSENVDFDSSQVGTIFVDGVTRFGTSVPGVQALRFQGENGVAIDYFDPEEVQSVLNGLSGIAAPGAQAVPSNALLLLDKLCRSRRYWFKPNDDDLFGSFDDLAGWPELKAALESSSMLRVEDKKQASGSNAEWIHIKNARGILLRDLSDEKVVALLQNVGWRKGQ